MFFSFPTLYDTPFRLGRTSSQPNFVNFMEYLTVCPGIRIFQILSRPNKNLCKVKRFASFYLTILKLYIITRCYYTILFVQLFVAKILDYPKILILYLSEVSKIILNYIKFIFQLYFNIEILLSGWNDCLNIENKMCCIFLVYSCFLLFLSLTFHCICGCIWNKNIGKRSWTITTKLQMFWKQHFQLPFMYRPFNFFQFSPLVLALILSGQPTKSLFKKEKSERLNKINFMC